MSISNNFLAKAAIQDIINADSNKAIKTSFNILVDIKNITNFYTIDFSFFLNYHHSKKCKNSNIEDKTS